MTPPRLRLSISALVKGAEGSSGVVSRAKALVILEIFVCGKICAGMRWGVSGKVSEGSCGVVSRAKAFVILEIFVCGKIRAGMHWGVSGYRGFGDESVSGNVWCCVVFSCGQVVMSGVGGKMRGGGGGSSSG